MKIKLLLSGCVLLVASNIMVGQTKQDSLEIKQTALDYIESQHKVNPKQMEGALHPRMVKRTFWKDKATNKDYVRETTTESMILLAESYNKKGDNVSSISQKGSFATRDVSERICFGVNRRRSGLIICILSKINGTSENYQCTLGNLMIRKSISLKL